MAITQYLSAKNFLLLNKTLISLHSFEGGVISADVIKDSVGPDLAVKKHLGAIHYEDFIFETVLNNEITDLIRKTWKGENLPLTSSFITTDSNFKVVYEDSVQDCLITETTIPKCDGASKDTALLKMRLSPDLIENQTGDGRVIGANSGQKQKAMLQSNFRFELGKLPCSRVATIDLFSVKANVSGNSLKNHGDLNSTTSSIDFPNLFLNISSADIKPWLEWQKHFMIDGNNDQSEELTGRLVFLTPNLKDELLAISLQGVGIFSLQRNVNPDNKISRFRVGLYCENMEIEGKKE